ncbi:MAG: cobyric acid synthase [archaeon]|nr:cobyric acid synthase [archaeon]
MKNIVKVVRDEIAAGNVGCKTDCPYNPCHFSGQNCTFCYCPYYPCNDERLGKFVEGRRGQKIWSCEDCLLIHRDFFVEHTVSKIKELGLEAGDPRFLTEVFPEAVEKFWHRGKAVMVVGATSDAGKSITVAAIGRILKRMGYLCAPFKSQNMSLNSRVTSDGAEIAMVQVLQAQAMGLKNADAHMNPILLKPMGNTRSQVVVEGKPFADYEVGGYYDEFVPGPGKEIVKRNVDFLLNHYDYVIMEGAGSPAEINIYDKDIANMRAAEIADADVILVVNVEWGGAFAYAVGTVELMPEEDRRRIKGIILNNVRGDVNLMRPGADRMEEILGIPVIGIIPHLDVRLPSEDSEMFRGRSSVGNGPVHVAVVKLPRIANFTDLDPLYSDDTTVVFAESPEDILDADAIVIPGTKNTIGDLQWMKDVGIYDALRQMKGKVPIVGICGGYQMMGKLLSDPQGIENGIPGDYEGLGFFDNTSTWSSYTKRVVRDRAVIIDGGGEVEGYEIHMGMSDVKETPLFRMTSFGREKETEGSVRKDEMLYGTYLHGVFDRPAFRDLFFSLVSRKDRGTAPEMSVEDYNDVVDRNLDLLADGFEKGLDMDAFKKIFGVKE